MDVLFDIHRITDSKVAIFDHHLLRDLPVFPNWCGPLRSHPLMSIRIQVHSTTQFMDFFVEMRGKGSDATCHYVDNRMRNMIFLNMLTTHFQCNNIIINCLCRPNLRNIYFETVGIVEFKFVVVDLCHAFKFVLIHAAISIGFTGDMIFDVTFILVKLRELINERFITAICSEAFCAHKIYMLHFFF